MALFSSRTLLTARLLVYTYASYLLIVAPKSIIEYSGVLILASSMKLPMIMVNEKSPIYAVIGLVLFTLVLCDVGPLVESNYAYFEITVLLRLILSFGLSIYCYIGSKNIALCNSVVFTYAFAEVWFGILTYTVLKEEKLNRIREVVKKSETTKLKYERGQLSEGDKEEFEKKMQEDEYQKLISEFK